VNASRPAGGSWQPRSRRWSSASPLWPEFLELQQTLPAYFDALTDRVIEQALEVQAGEAEERSEPALLEPADH
jgi:hypothetical protein